MVDAVALLVGAILRLFRARQRLVLENLALRQQLTTLHFNVTGHPSSTWIVQQLREAFLDQLVPRFLIFDRYDRAA
jgi:hypothetical protein